jgi:hypothetical protein
VSAAYDAFQAAARGELSPGDLAGVLRELLIDCKQNNNVPLCRELADFLAVDLGDYAYALAIHDQAAINELRHNIQRWAERLAREIKEGRMKGKE